MKGMPYEVSQNNSFNKLNAGNDTIFIVVTDSTCFMCLNSIDLILDRYKVSLDTQKLNFVMLLNYEDSIKAVDAKKKLHEAFSIPIWNITNRNRRILFKNQGYYFKDFNKKINFFGIKNDTEFLKFLDKQYRH